MIRLLLNKLRQKISIYHRCLRYLRRNYTFVLLFCRMPPRPKKHVQQGTGDVRKEHQGPNQDPIQHLVKLVVKAYKEGINEGRKSRTSKMMIGAKEDSKKEKMVNKTMKLKKVQIGRESNSKRKDFNRKCEKCRRKHSGKCLKGTNTCFKCGLEGHILSSCPRNRKNTGCFACGSTDHQVRECPKKEKKEVGGSSNPASCFGDK